MPKIDWHIVIKVMTGIFIVPLAIGAQALWPWWVKTSLPTKILSAILVLPFVGIAALLTGWWNNY